MPAYTISLIVLLLSVLPLLGTVVRVPADAPSIQAGLDTIHDGDTVLVSQGVYAEALIAPPFRFTLRGDVRTDSAEESLPVIDPSPLPGSDSLACLRLFNGSRPVLEDLKFRSGARMYPRWNERTSGIRGPADGIIMRRCVVDSTYRGVVHTWRADDEGIVDTLIDCVFRSVQVVGADLLDYPVIATGCHFVSGNAVLLFRAGEGSRIVGCRFGSNSGGHGVSLRSSDGVISNCTFGPDAVVSGYQLVLSQNHSQTVVLNNIFANNSVESGVLQVKVFGPDVFRIEQNIFANNVVLSDSATCIQVDRDGRTEPTWDGTIRYNAFVNCLGRSIGANAILADGDLEVTDNRFMESADDPFGLPAIYISRGDSSDLRGNLFLNTGFALRADAPSLHAEDNFWGHVSGPYHELENPSGQGDTITGNVDFDPWLPDTTDAAEKDRRLLPGLFSLVVFPNPFNSTARIVLSGPAGLYRVDLFNALGQRVQEIWHGPMVGDQEISFDGSRLAAGVYFVRVWEITAHKPAALRKMVLLK